MTWTFGRRMAKRKRCKDCAAEGITTNRPAKYPGPRCATHHRAKTKQTRKYNHGQHILKTYGITSEEYQRIYEAQGGKCFICKRATGQRRKLAVDHDHKTGFVRGLLCKTCNRKVLGHLRDDPEAFVRGRRYLEHPPAFDVIGRRVVPNHQPKG